MSLPSVIRLGLFSLLASVIFVSATLTAAEWSIPMAGNTFRQQPNQGRDASRRTGMISWAEATSVYSTFFHVSQAGPLQVSLNARVSSGLSELEARVGNQQFRLSIDSQSLKNHSIGYVHVTEPGYVRVDIQGIRRSGPVYAEMKELIVSSESTNLELDYVRSNKGNMFYWGRRGPSVHLRYKVPNKKDLQWAYSEVTVPEHQDPIGSFFMANGFGEGYFGFQVNRPTERRVLFSIWSPFRTDNPNDIPPDQRIVTLASGSDVHVGKFGNEGSGGQSYLIYPWQSGKTYRFLTEIKPDSEGNTVYTSWFGDKQKSEWHLIASFRRPKTSTYLRGFHSFLESFSPGYGHIGRRASYGNVWVADTDSQWHKCTEARFSVDATGNGRHRLDFGGGSEGTHFFLRNCGFFSSSAKPGTVFKLAPRNSEAPAINFDQLPRE